MSRSRAIRNNERAREQIVREIRYNVSLALRSEVWFILKEFYAKIIKFQTFPCFVFCVPNANSWPGKFPLCEIFRIVFFLSFGHTTKLNFVNGIDVHTKFFHMTPLDRQVSFYFLPPLEPQYLYIPLALLDRYI